MHILFFSPFSDRKSFAPCFHNSELKVGGERIVRLFFFFIFQLLEFSIPYLHGRRLGAHQNSSSCHHQGSYILQTCPLHLVSTPKRSICPEEKFYWVPYPGEDSCQTIKDRLMSLYESTASLTTRGSIH